MAAKPAVTKSGKTSRGDLQIKGKNASKKKRTSIGKSRNSRDTSKNSVRNRNGR